jgi:hypothetical protein
VPVDRCSRLLRRQPPRGGTRRGVRAEQVRLGLTSSDKVLSLTMARAAAPGGGPSYAGPSTVVGAARISTYESICALIVYISSSFWLRLMYSLMRYPPK